jgi:hypothetical protein
MLFFHVFPEHEKLWMIPGHGVCLRNAAFDEQKIHRSRDLFTATKRMFPALGYGG